MTVQGAKDDEALRRLVARVVEDARSRGRDYVSQTEEAVRAVQGLDNNLTSSEAWKLVERLRE